MINLGTLPGSYFSEGAAINNAGQVTGSSTFLSPIFSRRAFVYTNGVMLDLNSLIDQTLGWTLTGGSAINDLGQIAGSGIINGQTHAFLLTPTAVPEPSEWSLIAGGLAGLLWLHERSKSSPVSAPRPTARAPYYY